MATQNFQSCIITSWAVLWHLRSLQTHGSLTLNKPAGLYVVASQVAEAFYTTYPLVTSIHAQVILVKCDCNA